MSTLALVAYHDLINTANDVKRKFAELDSDTYPIEVYQYILDSHLKTQTPVIDVIEWACDITYTEAGSYYYGNACPNSTIIHPGKALALVAYHDIINTANDVKRKFAELDIDTYPIEVYQYILDCHLETQMPVIDVLWWDCNIMRTEAGSYYYDDACPNSTIIPHGEDGDWHRDYRNLNK